jgi:hypothetical protein
MAEPPGYVIAVIKDVDRQGSFRWSLQVGAEVRDKSLYSFATKREAQADAERFLL